MPLFAKNKTQAEEWLAQRTRKVYKLGGIIGPAVQDVQSYIAQLQKNKQARMKRDGSENAALFAFEKNSLPQQIADALRQENYYAEQTAVLSKDQTDAACVRSLLLGQSPEKGLTVALLSNTQELSKFHVVELPDSFIGTAIEMVGPFALSELLQELAAYEQRTGTNHPDRALTEKEQHAVRSGIMAASLAEAVIVKKFGLTLGLKAYLEKTFRNVRPK